jgi:hypothetical protein
VVLHAGLHVLRLLANAPDAHHACSTNNMQAHTTMRCNTQFDSRSLCHSWRCTTLLMLPNSFIVSASECATVCWQAECVKQRHS